MDVWELSHWSIDSAEESESTESANVANVANVSDTVDSIDSTDNNADVQVNPILYPEASSIVRSYQLRHYTRVKCEEPDPGEYMVAHASPAAYYQVRNRRLEGMKQNNGLMSFAAESWLVCQTLSQSLTT